MKKILIPILLVLVAFSVFTPTATVTAAPPTQDAPWCGSGKLGENVNYGFQFSLKQPYWTVNSEGFVSQETVNQAEVILNNLDSDNIVNMMVFFMDAKDVAVGSACAGQFNHYMRLGNVNGPRRDNGFTILFTVTHDPNGQAQQVLLNYALGGNLEKLHPDDLQEMKRIAERTFKETNSVDATYLAVLQYFNEMARSRYEPYHPTPSTQNTQPANPWQPFINCISFLFFFALIIIGLMVFAWILNKLGLLDLKTGPTTYTSPTHNDSPTLYDAPTHHDSPSTHQGGGSGNTSRTG